MSVIMFGTTKGLGAQFLSQLLHTVDRPEKEQKRDKKRKIKLGDNSAHNEMKMLNTRWTFRKR